MNWRTALAKLASPSTLGGTVLLAIGVHVIVTGELRSLVALGDERYFVGGVFIVTGAIVILIPVFVRNKPR